MPWNIKKMGDKFCVAKKSTGKCMGSKRYSSRKAATPYLRALYANESVQTESFADNLNSLLVSATNKDLEVFKRAAQIPSTVTNVAAFIRETRPMARAFVEFMKHRLSTQAGVMPHLYQREAVNENRFARMNPDLPAMHDVYAGSGGRYMKGLPMPGQQDEDDLLFPGNTVFIKGTTPGTPYHKATFMGYTHGGIFGEVVYSNGKRGTLRSTLIQRESVVNEVSSVVDDKGNIKMSFSDFVDEHKRLIDRLDHKIPQELDEEKREQTDELQHVIMAQKGPVDESNERDENMKKQVTNKEPGYLGNTRCKKCGLRAMRSELDDGLCPKCAPMPDDVKTEGFTQNQHAEIYLRNNVPFSRKPGSVKEIYDSVNFGELPGNIQAFIDDLEPIQLTKQTANDLYLLNLMPEDGMIRLLEYGESYFLVNTEGFKYPRYVTRLQNFQPDTDPEGFNYNRHGDHVGKRGAFDAAGHYKPEKEADKEDFYGDSVEQPKFKKLVESFTQQVNRSKEGYWYGFGELGPIFEYRANNKNKVIALPSQNFTGKLLEAKQVNNKWFVRLENKLPADQLNRFNLTENFQQETPAQTAAVNALVKRGFRVDSIIATGDADEGAKAVLLSRRNPRFKAETWYAQVDIDGSVNGEDIHNFLAGLKNR